MDANDFKVSAAAFTGLVSPNLTWLLDLEPTLKALLLLAQIGVAVATFLYVLAKWRKARK